MTSQNGSEPVVLETNGQTGMPPLVRIRHWVGSTLSGVADDHLSAVMLVCTELVTNAYEHADRPDQIRLWHTLTPCRVRVEVDDGVPEPPVPGASRLGDHRGRGMILVDKLADWGVHPTAAGKTVWAEIACDQRGIVRCPGD